MAAHFPACGIAVIYNPRAGAHRGGDRAARVAALLDALHDHDLDAAAWPTTGPGSGSDLAARAIAGGARVVVAVGGDGTVNEVLQSVARPNNQGDDVTMAIWPQGTANVLARELGLPEDAAGVARLIATGHTGAVQIGQAGDRYFLLMAGAGLDASVIGGVNPALKARVGQTAFFLTALGHLVRWRPTPFRVTIDGASHTAAFMVVSNTARYGGGFRFARESSLFKRTLEVCLFPVRQPWRYVRYALACRLDRPFVGAGVVRTRAACIETACSSTDAPWVQVDGELHGRLPMTFRALPGVLKLLLPPDAGTLTGGTV